MRKVLVAAGVRTPIGGFHGALHDVSAVELGRASSVASLLRAGIAGETIDEVIMGNVLSAGLGQNVSRQVAIAAGIPEHVPAFSINKVCGSGLKSVDCAAQAIALGKADVVLAGGTENMSQSPYLLPAMRKGAKLGHVEVLDSVVHDGLTDAFGGVHMGITAENLVDTYSLTREEQDAFALESQKKCAVAVDAGLFKEESTPVCFKKRGKELSVDADEHPRPEADMGSLGQLRPVFKKDGTVTAGNASGINDGAATVVLLGEDALSKSSLAMDECFVLRASSAVGCAPAMMGLGPVGAVAKLLKDEKLATDDIGLWELNEAFAAQSLVVMRELALDATTVNVNGGAIALGHPIGASGTRILVTLMHQMKRQNIALGVAALCIGGGMGIAVLLENC